jgi:flagellar hook-associated protein 1 FlgK
MLGLFGTLSLTTRSLQVQQQGIEVTGHNLANVNNPDYARQKIAIQTSQAIQGENGFLEGSGADVAGIQQVRDSILDAQMVTENGISGSLDAQQQALQYAQSDLGQQIDSGATGAEGATAASVTGGQHAIGDAINDLFDSLQSLSTQPSSDAQRGIVVDKATQLAQRFQLTDSRLQSLHDSLNQGVSDDVDKINSMLSDIAKYNQQIAQAEATGSGVANDLRDTRQAKLEALGQLVKFDQSAGQGGSVNISIGGTLMVDSTNVTDTLQAYDSGGNTMVRASTAGTPLNITSGHISGLIEARDGAVQSLRDNLSTLASNFITEMNQIHQIGYGKDGSTGLPLFTGTNASDIAVNSDIAKNPAKLAASDTLGESGNNNNVISLADLRTKVIAGLNNQTFTQSYSAAVANLGSALNSTNQQISDQTVVSNMVKTQRDSVSAVSMDEEMTNLVTYQRAYQASAQVVNVINAMFDSVLNMMN